MPYSCPYQEDLRPADQVQGPLRALPLHPCPQGPGQGREAEAVSSPWYAQTKPTPLRQLLPLKKGDTKSLEAHNWLIRGELHRSYHLRDPQEEREGQARRQVNGKESNNVSIKQRKTLFESDQNKRIKSTISSAPQTITSCNASIARPMRQPSENQSESCSVKNE